MNAREKRLAMAALVAILGIVAAVMFVRAREVELALLAPISVARDRASTSDVVMESDSSEPRSVSTSPQTTTDVGEEWREPSWTGPSEVTIEIIDDAKQPIAQALVEHHFVEGRAQQSTRTGPDGSCTIQRVGERGLHLRASADGYLPRENEDFGFESRVSITLYRLAEIVGTVTNRETHAVVEGASIQAQILAPRLIVISEATSDATGKYRLSGVPVQTVLLHAAAEGFAGQEFTMQVQPKGLTRIDVSLDPGLVITGRIVDHVSGSPIGAATIFDGRDLLGKTDNAGLFRVRIRTSEPPALLLRFSADGYCGIKPFLKRADVIDKPLAIRLVRSAAIAGRAVDSLGAPVVYAQVCTSSTDDRTLVAALVASDPNSAFVGLPPTWWILEREPTLCVRTDARGTFVLDGIVPSKRLQQVNVDHPDFSDGQSDPVVLDHPGQVEQIVVRLQRGGSVRGRLFLNDMPAVGEVRCNGGGVSTDEIGVFVCTRLQPGHLALTGIPQPLRSFKETGWVHIDVEIKPGETIDVDLRARQKLSVVGGRVTTPAGDPLGGYKVVLAPTVSNTSNVPPNWRKATNADGTYQFVVPESSARFQVFVETRKQRIVREDVHPGDMHVDFVIER